MIKAFMLLAGLAAALCLMASGWIWPVLALLLIAYGAKDELE